MSGLVGEKFPGQTGSLEFFMALPDKIFCLGLASLCMLATLATQTPMLCFGFASAALMFFALTSFGQKTSHPASGICQALDKNFCQVRP